MNPFFSFEHFTGEIERVSTSSPRTPDEYEHALKHIRSHLETCDWYCENAELLELDSVFLNNKIRSLRIAFEQFTNNFYFHRIRRDDTDYDDEIVDEFAAMSM
jgi:hypothetical protein